MWENVMWPQKPTVIRLLELGQMLGFDLKYLLYSMCNQIQTFKLKMVKCIYGFTWDTNPCVPSVKVLHLFDLSFH